MARARGFAPVAGADARLLILGSMPGARSLSERQYYAHPQNAFWRIVGEVLAFDATTDYAQKLAALRKARVALWDVLASCERSGSLDADIVAGSIEVNPFAAFFKRQPQIVAVYFNGATAQRLYSRHVLPTLGERDLRYLRLPSTSPAHAALTYAQKFAAWRTALASVA